MTAAAIMLMILALIAVSLLAILPVIYRAGYKRGKLDGQFAAQHQQLDERWDDFGERIAEAGKHRAGQPRQTPGDAVAGDLWAIRPKPRRRLVTTAADLAPVVIPQDGTVIPLRHQPAPSPERPTATMPKLTDTGELRARTDERIMRMREDTEAWLAETRLT